MSDTTEEADAAQLSSASEESAGRSSPESVPREEPLIDPVAERKKIKAERRRLLFRNGSFIVGAVILGFWILCALFPSLFTQWGPNEVVRLADGSTIPRVGPRADAWFGTDSIGNDVFARIIYGARQPLILAPVAAGLAAIAGTVLGLIMGYYRGWIDETLSRVIEAFLSLPVILLALMVIVIFEASFATIIATIAVLFTPVVTRTVRSTVIAEAQLDYVTSAKLRGEKGWFIMLREILPNVTGVIVVEFTVRVGYAIFTVATLAFLGFSAGDATQADWGRDVAENRNLIIADQWWAAVFPAIAIATLVIAINLIADALDQVAKS